MPVNFSQTHTPSPREVEEGRTPAGGYDKATLAQWGISWPPKKGWQLRLLRQWAEEHGAVEYHSRCPESFRVKARHDWVDSTPAEASISRLWVCAQCEGIAITKSYPQGHPMHK